VVAAALMDMVVEEAPEVQAEVVVAVALLVEVEVRVGYIVQPLEPIHLVLVEQIQVVVEVAEENAVRMQVEAVSSLFHILGLHSLVLVVAQ
jgi:hypothetical protein